MNTLSNIFKSNVDARYIIWLDDLSYLKALNIKDTILKSKEDVECLLEIYSNLDHLHTNEFESWTASEFDSFYGWEILPDNLLKVHLLTYLDIYKTLYIKIIEDRVINVYTNDSININNLVISLSIISD